MTSYNTATLNIQNTIKKNVKSQTKTTILGNYEIFRKSIGKGSFSKIYLGTCLKTNRQVAIKIIKKRNIKNENTVLREIQMMKMIHHKNIIKLIDVLSSNNKYYLILEYCSNGDLKHYTKNIDITEKKLHTFMIQIRDGLYELYINNIIHRDLKPHNILVTHDNMLKISDFGFAKSYKPDNNLKQTMCGSPIYMAPEILQGKSYNINADLWSFGVIMYELYYGKVPINGYDIGNLINNVRKFEYVPGNKPISYDGEDLLRNLLKKDPSERISWNKFIKHPWFKSKFENNIDESVNTTYINDNNDNNESNMLLFQMDDIPEDEIKVKNNSNIINAYNELDLDETVMFRSDVNINKTYRSISSHDDNYIISEYYDDNYVIINSPSEMDIYTRPHLKSFDMRDNESEYDARRSAKYVKLKRIFNSLRDSISYIFRPKSI